MPDEPAPSTTGISPAGGLPALGAECVIHALSTICPTILAKEVEVAARRDPIATALVLSILSRCS